MLSVYDMSGNFTSASSSSFFNTLTTTAQNTRANATTASKTHNEDKDAEENGNYNECDSPAS